MGNYERSGAMRAWICDMCGKVVTCKGVCVVQIAWSDDFDERQLGLLGDSKRFDVCEECKARLLSLLEKEQEHE